MLARKMSGDFAKQVISPVVPNLPWLNWEIRVTKIHLKETHLKYIWSQWPKNKLKQQLIEHPGYVVPTPPLWNKEKIPFKDHYGRTENI